MKRWRRYGKDRLYVNLPDGSRVGWHDLVTEEAVVEREEHRAAFEQAVEQYLRSGSDEEPSATSSRPAETARPAPEPHVTPQGSGGVERSAEPYAVKISWTDLARNDPGEAASEQAVRHRQAAPVKALAAQVLGVHNDERAWRIGADGERKVAARLSKLPEAWTVLHALPVGSRGADIDHLVIGPAGVFTINAKHHPDGKVWVGGNTVMVNGQRHPYVRNARHEARRAARHLSGAVGFPVTVRGVIAFVGAEQFKVKAQPDDVGVIARRQLPRWLLDQPPTLTPEQVTAIAHAARRSDTWRQT